MFFAISILAQLALRLPTCMLKHFLLNEISKVTSKYVELLVIQFLLFVVVGFLAFIDEEGDNMA